MTAKGILNLGLKILLLGVLIGLFISFYQFIMHEIIAISNDIFQSNNSLLIFIMLVIAIILSFIIIFINNKYKGYLGSGIPQYEAFYDGNLDFSPFKMFFLVLFDSLYAYFCGFPLGGEGPSITLSASLAKMITKDKELIAASGSTGFCVAFLAPLAGFFHLIEENRHYVKISFLFKGFILIIIASLVAYLVYPHNLLPIFVETALDYKYYYLIVIVSIIAFIVGRLYVLAIIKVKDMSKIFKNFLYLTPLFSLLFLFYMTKDLYFIGSGQNILANPLFTTSIMLCVFYLFYRLLGTAFSNSLAVSGGLVLPMLSLGALCGLLVTLMFKDIIPNITKYNDILVVVGMLVLYNSVCKTPLTALALSFKMGSFINVFLPVLIGIIISTSLLYLLKQQNIYKLLERRILNVKSC